LAAGLDLGSPSPWNDPPAPAPFASAPPMLPNRPVPPLANLDPSGPYWLRTLMPSDRGDGDLPLSTPSANAPADAPLQQAATSIWDSATLPIPPALPPVFLTAAPNGSWNEGDPSLWDILAGSNTELPASFSGLSLATTAQPDEQLWGKGGSHEAGRATQDWSALPIPPALPPTFPPGVGHSDDYDPGLPLISPNLGPPGTAEESTDALPIGSSPYTRDGAAPNASASSNSFAWPSIFPPSQGNRDKTIWPRTPFDADSGFHRTSDRYEYQKPLDSLPPIVGQAARGFSTAKGSHPQATDRAPNQEIAPRPDPRLVISDASPEPWVPGARYAQQLPVRGVSGPSAREPSLPAGIRLQFYTNAYRILQNLDPKNPELRSMSRSTWVPENSDIGRLNAEIARLRCQRGSLGLERHHAFPLEFEANFRACGIDPEAYAMFVPKGLHRLRPDGLHTGSNHWNAQWRQFIQEQKKPTPEKFFNHLNTMLRKLPWLQP
jgi:hypothetical protein